ncbi:hypothetical protein ACS3SW_16115 [Roseobacteraceae bacterium S113]
MPAGLASTRNAAQALALASVLAGCALDSEAELRSEVAGWTSIAETIYFASERNCSAALYRLTSGVLRTQISACRKRSRWAGLV